MCYTSTCAWLVLNWVLEGAAAVHVRVAPPPGPQAAADTSRVCPVVLGGPNYPVLTPSQPGLWKNLSGGFENGIVVKVDGEYHMITGSWSGGTYSHDKIVQFRFCFAKQAELDVRRPDRRLPLGQRWLVAASAAAIPSFQ